MENRGFWLIGAAFVLLILAPILLLGCMAVVDPSQVCVVTSLGTITAINTGGFHPKAVWDSYHCYPTYGVIYETLADENRDKSLADYKDGLVTTQTTDGQTIQVSYSIKAHPNPDPEKIRTVYTTVGQDMAGVVERVIKFYSRGDVRQVLQRYKAEPLYSGQTTVAQNELRDLLTPKFASQHIMLDDFVIRQIIFDADYVQAIENKQIAFENITTQRNNAEAENQKAQSRINEAQGEAKAELIRAEQKAKALQLLGDQLARYPQLVQYELVQRLNNVQWGFLPSNALPFLNVDPAAGKAPAER